MINWREIPDGQRVTFEAEVAHADERVLDLMLSGGDGGITTVYSYEADAAVCELIDPPLRVGPTVHKETGNRCRVLHIANDIAWVIWPDMHNELCAAAQFRNIEEGGE